MAHFRCPTSSIVGSTDRYYSAGDTVQYRNASAHTQSHPSIYMDNNSIDLNSSGDESASSSSSSTILASRTMNRSSTRKTTPPRRHSSTKSKTPVLATNLSGQQTAASSSRSTIQSTQPLLPSSTNSNSTNIEPVNINDQGTEKDRKCWICYGDDGDSEGNWVSPCPCSLVAHEKCLLDWITENQKGSPRKLVHCPQCASSYHLVEKSNWSLSFLGVIDEVTHTIAPYITSLGLGLSLMVVTTTYGASSVILLFGAREGERILGSPSFWTWRTWVGLPSIPLALLSTRSRLADSFLPFFAFLVLRLSSNTPTTTSPSSLPFIQFSWPPTPLATLGILPWVRLAYNNIYYAAQGLISRQLSLKMVQDQHRRQRNNNNNQLVLMGDLNANQISHDHTVDPTTTTITAIEQQSQERSIELDILLGRGPPSVGMLFMSTLLWPAVGNITGSCLSQVGWIRQRLPEPFHRNILGGCLFVVIKDVGNLLYRYQKVRQYRSRHIQNYNEIKRNS